MCFEAQDVGLGRRRGFTLLELVLAISLVVVFFGLGGLALQGWRGTRALEDRLSAIEMVARSAQTAVLQDQRPWVVVFTPDRVAALPAGSAPTDAVSSRRLEVKLEADEKIYLRRIGSGAPEEVEEPQFWRFEPRALSEPIEIRVESSRGWISGTVDPLSGRMDEITMEVN